jgi:ABC-type spermidine/putrescine transport system permease subunit I
MSRSRVFHLLLVPSALLWLSGVLLPLLAVLRMSLYARGDASGEHQFDVLFYQPGTWSLENFVKVASDPFYLRTSAFTLALGLLVTSVTLVLGFVLAYAIYRSSARGKVLLVTLIVLPKFANILVYVYGLKLLLGPNGFWPVVAGEVLLLLPYAALTIAAALEAVPYSLIEAAHGLGASGLRAFWSVTFPLCLPGFLAAGTLTVLWSLTAFLGPYLLGEPHNYTLAVEVDRQTRQDMNWALAGALNVVLIGAMAAIAYGLSAARRRLA